jgi:ADP-ribosyl-[dinitrogen reductase] hydrolase
MTRDHNTSISPRDLTHPQQVRAYGALVGCAVADAVGAPFEFKRAGLYGETFPTEVLGGIGEMIGGGSFGWAPGEFTDDTQMALALAEALEAGEGFDPAVVWAHFRAWADSAVDVGITIGTSLRFNSHVGAAEKAHQMLGGRTASNGAAMRIAPVGIVGVLAGREMTYEIAVAQASITHFDPAASAGAAIVAEIIRQTIVTGDFETAVTATFEYLAGTSLASVVLEQFVEICSPCFDPLTHAGPPNGTIWTAVAQAIWAVRSTTCFHDAVVAAIDLGGDTDTVAAIAGSMAGAFYGLQGIPIRWTTYVHGHVVMPDGRKVQYRCQDLVDTARRLLALGNAPRSWVEPPVQPGKVHELGVWASNLDGARLVPNDFGVVSLCITDDRFIHHPYRRGVYMRDSEGDRNPELFFVLREAVEAIDAFLQEGRQVVVHCHGGRSRTTFVLKAWYMLREGKTHAEAHQWVGDEWPLYETWTRTFLDVLDNEWSDYVEAVHREWP